MSEFKNTYKHNATNVLVKMKNLGMGEKKIKYDDGSETKISNSELAKDYTFHSSDDKRISNISKRMRTRSNKLKKVI